MAKENWDEGSQPGELGYNKAWTLIWGVVLVFCMVVSELWRHI